MAKQQIRSGVILFLLLGLHLSSLTAFGKRLPVRAFTSADGLGSSFVNYLASDSRGFMWFCTRDGLSRFDGSRFVTYQVADKDSPPGIESIFETRDGSYWITTTGGIYRFDPNKITTPDAQPRSLNAEFITSLRGWVYEDRNGNLWLGGSKFYRIEKRNGVFEPVEADLGIPPDPLVGSSVTGMVSSDDGSFWINTTRGLIRRLPDGRQVFYPDAERRASPAGSVKMILDHRGMVWLARSNNLFIINPDPIESLPDEKLIITPVVPRVTYDVIPEGPAPLTLASGEIIRFRNPTLIESRFAKSLLQSSDKSVWVASEDNLLEFANDTMHAYSTSDGLPNVMNHLAEDNVGNLWIAGQSTLGRLDRKGLVTFGTEDGAASDRFLAIFQGPDGTMYFGNPDSQISRFDGQRFTSVKPAVAPDAAHLWTSRIAYLDSHGDWWLLTGKKLFRFSGVKKFEDLNGRKPSASYGRDTGLRSDGILQIFEDSSGSIWVATRGNDFAQNGLSRLRAGESNFTTFTEVDGLPPERSPSSFVEDPASGNIWVTFVEGGVIRFDGERFHDFAAETGMDSTGILTDIHLDTRGRLWITSAAAGVYRIDHPTSESPGNVRLSVSDGLSSNNVRTVTEDRLGRIYFGTARGVDRLSPDTGRFKHYTVADGLRADFVSDSYCDRSGNIWFSTNDGVSRLVPVPDGTSAAPSVMLGGLRIAGVPQPTAELGTREIATDDLSNWQNNLQIEFYGIDFRAGETLRYQYKLEGSNSDWSEPSENRTVTFANLQPATYRFLVRAMNSDGVTSEVPAVVSFRILPPLWQRWWFLAACAALVAISVTLLYRYRIENLRRVNRALSEAKFAEESLRHAQEERLAELESVRSRIATDLHDDIGASLTQIAILSEVAQANESNGNGRTAESLARITDVSNELVGTMSDIVWAINPAKDHLSDLTQRMRRFASDVLSPKGIHFTFDTPEAERAIVVNTNIRREVFLIFKESVNNIAKHSAATDVGISLSLDGGFLVFEIVDDGKGFDPTSEDHGSGNGILSMNRRAAEMGGELRIDSRPENGTSISLRLPIEQTFAG